MDSIKALWAWFQQTRPWQSWQRYGKVRGNVLAGGVSYFAFFSVFPAVALAFTVFNVVLSNRPDVLEQVTNYINTEILPGFVKTADNPDGIISIAPPSAAALTLTGVVSFVTLLLAGLGWLGGTRDGIRAIFRVEGAPGNAIMLKLRDIGVLILFGIGIVVSAVLSTAVGGAASWVADVIGLANQAWLLTVVGLVVGALLDAVLMLLLLRVLSGIDIPWPDLWQGALVGGIGFTLLKFFGAALLRGSTTNPLYASFALVVGLLVWLNLIARITLLAAAWAANDVDRERALASQSDATATEGPVKDIGPVAIGPVTAAQALQELGSPRDPTLPNVGVRAQDRVALGAGAVLGATVAFGLTSVGRALAGFRRR